MGKRCVEMGKGMPSAPVDCSVCGNQTYTYYAIEKYHLCSDCGPKYKEPVKAYYSSDDGYAQLSLKDYLKGMGYDDEK